MMMVHKDNKWKCLTKGKGKAKDEISKLKSDPSKEKTQMRT
jgi:hypothetical protein